MHLRTIVPLFVIAIQAILYSTTHAEANESIPESVITFWEYEWQLELDELIADLSEKFGVVPEGN